MTAKRPRPPITVEAKVRSAIWTLERLNSKLAGHVEIGLNIFPEYLKLGAWNPKRPIPRSRKVGKLLLPLLQAIASQLGCKVEDLRCDHNPALRVRAYNERIKNVAARYTPNANDPTGGSLFWRAQGREFEGSHCVKTNVRGENGQLSDKALIKRERRLEKRKAAARSASVSAPKARRPKTKWASGRKLPSRPFRRGVQVTRTAE